MMQTHAATLPVDVETLEVLEARRVKWNHENHGETIRLLCALVNFTESQAHGVVSTLQQSATEPTPAGA